jgi:uncharacterized membrane protein
LAEEKDEENVDAEDEKTMPRWLFLLLATGFALIFIGILFVVLAVAVGSGGSASAGVIIFIGPFPIAFGAGPDAIWLVLIGIILAVISLMLFIFMRRKVIDEGG